MVDIEKMNECLAAGLINSNAQLICDQTYNLIAEFQASHMTDEAGKLLKDGKFIDRGQIIKLFMDDMHRKIFHRGGATYENIRY